MVEESPNVRGEGAFRQAPSFPTGAIQCRYRLTRAILREVLARARDNRRLTHGVVTVCSCIVVPVSGLEIKPLRLAVPDAGEMLTLQRAAYVTEAQEHDDLAMPALTQTLGELIAELADPLLLAYGIRESGRLVASLRVRRVDADTVEVGRLVVAPDRQGNGLGSALLAAAEQSVPGEITTMRLFTGERSEANLRLYRRLGYRETHRTVAGGYQLVHLAKALRGRPAR